jgi:L-alanine-DL-glutamate epimerase-like enolase superfamily enzyme
MSSPDIEMTAYEQSWPLDNPFRTARGPSNETRVVVVRVSDGRHVGRGECVPIKRYGQNAAATIAELSKFSLTGPISRAQIQKSLPANAARNALDCALWDLEAKVAGKRAWELANIEIADAVETAFTISLDTPEKMAAVARVNAKAPVLKLKLGGDKLDVARVEAVRSEAPPARLFVDANESWSPAHYQQSVSALARLGVELIEQPFPADADAILETLNHPVPVCADESCHTSIDLPRLVRRYEAINVKLDKTGGLTEALLLTERARQTGFKLLFGCMVCTSLGIAPARILARTEDYVDLDGPLLLAGDRHHPLSYDNGRIGLPSRELWG